jgi:hypothetical protein
MKQRKPIHTSTTDLQRELVVSLVARIGWFQPEAEASC